MRRALIVLGMLICAVGIASPTPAATHFSHADHAQRGLAIDTCETCHGVDAKGQIAPPAALGHAPCQSAPCHATYFVSIGDKTRKADPARYARATAFCLGCHDSKDGAPPAPWQKPTTGAALASFQYEREYHVEMNHFAHTQRAECRSCHIVDAKTFALITSTPGHAQCVACHNPQKFPAFTMDKCGLCHATPARTEFFGGTRPKVDVRACGSEGQAAFEARAQHAVSCFRHERAEHRTADGQSLSCAACHYMVGDKTRWGKRRYQSLRDLHTEAIIDNSQDRQHKSCGQSTACHRADVDAARPGAKCALCHAEKSAF
ncbi:MAG TPA: hypothetical protein VHN14_17470 [Kofleriaceae bacterium]|nr:hypothetical protein [Kofleriaceae bacterium]